MSVFEFRKTGGYALVTAIDPVVFRAVSGYVLADEVKRPNLTLPGLTGLLAAINKEKNTTLTAGQVTFSDPVAVVDAEAFYNTTIKVTAKKSSGYSGDYTFTYHRFLLEEAFDGKLLEMPGVVGTTIWGTLAAINTKYSLGLEARDVADAPLASGATTLLLTVLSTSVYYKPGTTVRLGVADNDVPFATIAPVTDALGFDPEA